MPKTSKEITRLLQDWGNGEEKALEDLLPLVFDDLRRMASRYLSRERFYTLQSTALVNEVFLRLLKRNTMCWENRSQFFGFVATEMRRILVDHARKKKSNRRGSGQRLAPLDEALEVAAKQDVNLVALGDALDDLARADTGLSNIVELRFFVGLTHEQIADVLETSIATVRRRWTSAKTWLYREVTTRTKPRPDRSREDHDQADGRLPSLKSTPVKRPGRVVDSGPKFVRL